jgi:PIN domain nuclease of toxin-antitoxin system
MGERLVFLLDTHVVVWIALAPDRLSKKAVRAIDDARKNGRGLSISDITLFELASLVARQRIQLQVSLESFLEEVESRFVIIPMNRHIAARCVQLPGSYPNDPMDRIIGATAIVEGLPLITSDERITKSRTVTTVW